MVGQRLEQWIELTWSWDGEGGEDTTWNGRSCDAVVNNSTVYCRYDTSHVYGVGHAYVPTTYIPSSSWSPVPDCPHSGFALAVIDGLLTAVGGWGGDCKNTNKLLSLTGKGSGREWTEKFPPMPTKHYDVSALCTGATLIVGELMITTRDCAEYWDWTVVHCKWSTSTIVTVITNTLWWSALSACWEDSIKTCRAATNSVYYSSLSSLIGSKSLGERLVSSYTDTIQQRQPMEQSCWPPLNLLHCCESSCQLPAIGGSSKELFICTSQPL